MLSSQHHGRVSRITAPADYQSARYPWKSECTCGLEEFGNSWRLAYEYSFAHVKANNSVVHFDEPVDLAPLVKTRLAWDLLNHQDMRRWLPLLGLTPGAEDMTEIEHQEAHDRIDKMAPLSGLAETYALLIAEINAVFLAEEHKGTTGDHLSNEDVEDLTSTSYRMIRSGIFALLAEWLHDGLLEYGPAVKVHLAAGGLT